VGKTPKYSGVSQIRGDVHSEYFDGVASYGEGGMFEGIFVEGGLEGVFESRGFLELGYGFVGIGRVIGDVDIVAVWMVGEMIVVVFEEGLLGGTAGEDVAGYGLELGEARGFYGFELVVFGGAFQVVNHVHFV